MKIITLRKSLLYKAVAAALLCLFVLNDVTWANPDILEKGGSSYLQVPSAIQRPTDETLVKIAIKVALEKCPEALSRERYFSVTVHGKKIRPYFHPENKDGSRQIVPVSIGSRELLAVLNHEDLSITEVAEKGSSNSVLLVNKMVVHPQAERTETEEIVVDTDNVAQKLARPQTEIPPSPAGIKSFKDTFTPEMSYEEYSLKVAWWLEELVFFTLPMIFVHFIFGIGGREYMITMALAQAAFYFFHDGAFSSVSPKKHAIQFIVAVFGGLLAATALPLASFGLLQNPVIVGAFIIGASIIKIFGHREANLTAFRFGWSPAALAEGASISFIKYEPKKLAKELSDRRKLERDALKSYSMSIKGETLAKLNVAPQLSTEEKLKIYLRVVAHITAQLSKQYGIEPDRDRMMGYLETIISKSSENDKTIKVLDQIQAEVVTKFERITRGEEIPLTVKMGNIGAVSTLDLATNTIGIDAGVLLSVASHLDAKDPIATIEVLLASIIARQFFGHLCSTPEQIVSEETSATLNLQDAKYFGNFISKAKVLAPKANVYSQLYKALQEIKDPAEIPFTAFYAVQASAANKYALKDLKEAKSALYIGAEKDKAHKYKPLAVLGEGGMGIVLLAYDLTEGKKVAIKIAKLESMGGAQGADRFKNEILLTRKVGSDNVVKITDWGEYGSGEDINYYYVMEYLPWPTLKNLIGKLPIDDCVTIMILLANAVNDVHRTGLVHRDIKPENVMVSPNMDDLRLMDFGLIKDLGMSRSQGLTMSGVAMGTPHYMAPEQCMDSKNTDQRSDIYSLGAMLYEMVTGQKPFDGDNSNQIMMAAIHNELVRPSKINPNVDQDLEYIIMRAMEKDRDARYQNASELMNDLAAWLNGFEVQQAQPGVLKTISKVKLKVDHHVKAAKGRQIGGSRRLQQMGAREVKPPSGKAIRGAERKGSQGRREAARVGAGQVQQSWWTSMRIGAAVLAVIGLLGLFLIIRGGDKELPKPKPPTVEVAKPEPVKPGPIVKPEPIKPGPAVKPETVEIAPTKPEPVKPEPTAIKADAKYSLNFDGATQYCLYVNKELTKSQQITLSAWVRTSSSNPMCILGLGTNVILQIKSNGFANLTYKCGPSTWRGVTATTSPVNNGQWHHVAVVIDTGDINRSDRQIVYVDGKVVKKGSCLDKILWEDASGNNVIGKHAVMSENYFNGNIYDCRVYDRVLSDSEIVKIAGWQEAVATGLIAHWPLDEGSGTKAIDKTGRGHDMQINGVTWQKDSPFKPQSDSVPKKPGGAWWDNATYKQYVAWFETPLVLILTVLLPQDYTVWAWIVSGFLFWVPHFIGNKQAVYTGDVLGLTAATALVASLFPTFGLYSFVTMAAAGLVTLGHLIINMKRTATLSPVSKKSTTQTKVLPLEIDYDVNSAPTEREEAPTSATMTGNTPSLSGESKVLMGSDPAIIRSSPISPATEGLAKDKIQVKERFGMPMLRDLRSPEQLALCIVEQLESLSITNKLVLAFDSNVAAGYAGNPLNVIRYLEELQKSGKYPSIKNVEIVINTPENLVTKINEYEGDKNAEVFMFAMNESRAALKDVKKRVHATFIEKNEFEPSTYYPLAEVVAIAVAQYFDNIITSDGTITTLMLGDQAIDLRDLKIASLSYEQGILIFKLLPKSEQYDTTELSRRYSALKAFLEAA